MINISACPCILVAANLLALATSPALADATHYDGRTEYHAPKAEFPPTIDGVAKETMWKNASWQALDQRWLGPEYIPEDFRGRYKVIWTESKKYILGEFTDDILFDNHRDPLR